jgi:hypothetical protein
VSFLSERVMQNSGFRVQTARARRHSKLVAAAFTAVSAFCILHSAFRVRL